MLYMGKHIRAFSSIYLGPFDRYPKGAARGEASIRFPSDHVVVQEYGVQAAVHIEVQWPADSVVVADHLPVFYTEILVHFPADSVAVREYPIEVGSLITILWPLDLITVTDYIPGITTSDGRFNDRFNERFG